MATVAHTPRMPPSQSGVVVYRYILASGSDPENGQRKVAAGRDAAAREDLPYKVELWNAEKVTVEQVLAVTSNSSIGYAAYYAATREYPDRLVTLRHKGRTVVKSHTPDN